MTEKKPPERPVVGSRAIAAFAYSMRRETEEHLRYLRQRKAEMEGRVLDEQDRIQKSKADREPIVPAKWIENEYFCGELARTVYPAIKEAFVDIFDSKVFLVVMGGAIGSGKTTLAKLMNLYSLYLLTCYGVPQRAFRGMLETAVIMFMNMNVTEHKAKDAYFKSFNLLLKNVPYFKNDFPLHPNLINEYRVPSKNILGKFAGATKTAAESEDLIFLVMDEVNLYDVVDKSKRAIEGQRFDAAEVVFQSGYRRMQTRYMLPDGSMPNPAKLVCLCKETYPDSFIRRKIDEIEKADLIKQNKARVYEWSEWETKPSKTYTGGRFWVMTGSVKESPRVIDDPVEAEAMKARSLELEKSDAAEDEKFEVIEVPIAWRPSANKELPDFIRDVCGRATRSIGVFYRSRECIHQAIREPGKGDWPAEVCYHPFTFEETTLRDGGFLIKERLAKRDNDGNWRPLMNPSAARFAHIDTGLTRDALGLAVGHCCGWREVMAESRSGDVGQMIVEKRPMIWLDYVQRVVPPPGGEIRFSDVRRLFTTLRQLGFRLYRATLDSWQSVEMIQWFDENGVESEVLSVDTSVVPYKRQRTAYEEGRISVYPYPHLEVELVELELVRTGRVKDGKEVEKVDHPPRGKKDVSDAVAGVVFGIEEWASSFKHSDMAPAIGTNEPVKGEVERKAEAREMFERGDIEGMYELLKGEED